MQQITFAVSPEQWRERMDDPQGVGMNVVPPCRTSVPLEVHWGVNVCKMRLVGGLMGVSQSPNDLALQPECSWAIVYDDATE